MQVCSFSLFSGESHWKEHAGSMAGRRGRGGQMVLQDGEALADGMDDWSNKGTVGYQCSELERKKTASPVWPACVQCFGRRETNKRYSTVNCGEREEWLLTSCTQCASSVVT